MCEVAQTYLMALVNSVLLSFSDSIVLRSDQNKWKDVAGAFPSTSSEGSVPSIPGDSVSAGLSHSDFGSTRLQ